MDWTRLFELLLTIASSLIALYFLFIRSWLKTIASNIADLSTKKELTEIEERVKEDFNKKLEDYKAKINEELALKIEPLKSELEKNNITHQIQYSYLHNERAKVIQELYGKFNSLHYAMKEWIECIYMEDTYPNKTEIQKARAVNILVQEFNNYFRTNQIFLSRKLAKSIKRVFDKYRLSGWDFAFLNMALNKDELNINEAHTLLNELRLFEEEMLNQLPKELNKIEDEFRMLLKTED